MQKSSSKTIFPVWAMLALGVSTAPTLRPCAVAQSGQQTADSQSNTKADLALTAQIRKALMDDKTLSMSAHNVKIITRNGMVTLRGAVASEAEKAAVAAKAREIAGADMVTDSLLTLPPKTN
jgi:hyperosmotically inducible periplasmic protein